MKTLTALASVMLVAGAAYGFYPENGMYNLETPLLGLSPWELESRIDHRFLGEAFDDPLDDLFGLDVGANVRLRATVVLPEGFDATGSYTRLGSQWTMAAGWSGALGPIGLRAGLGMTSTEAGPDERENGLEAQLSLEPVDRVLGLQPVISAGYDGSDERIGAGFGIDGRLNDRFSLWAEYVPVLEDDEGTGDDGVYNLGVTVRTYGHQFMLSLGNGTGTGLIDAMHGAADGEPRFGFSIRRLLSL